MTDLIELTRALSEKSRAFDEAMKDDAELDPRIIMAIELIGAHLMLLEWYQDECDRLSSCLPVMMAVTDDAAFFRA